MCAALLLLGLDDVIAELRADKAGGLAGVEGHRGLGVGGIETAGRHHGELAALVLGAGVVGVLLREIGEVAAGLKLLEDVLRLGFGGASVCGVGALGHGDQDVAGLAPAQGP